MNVVCVVVLETWSGINLNLWWKMKKSKQQLLSERIAKEIKEQKPKIQVLESGKPTPYVLSGASGRIKTSKD